MGGEGPLHLPKSEDAAWHAERLRMIVREERDQGRIDESEAISLHRFINRAFDALKPK